MKLTRVAVFLLGFIAAVAICTTSSSDSAQIVAKLGQSRYGAAIAMLLEQKSTAPANDDAKTLITAFDLVTKSVGEMSDEEDAAYAAAKAAYERFKTKMEAALASVKKHITETSLKLYDDLKPQETELLTKLVTLSDQVLTTKGLIESTTKDIATFKADQKVQEGNINECIEAIDKALALLTPLKENGKTALLQTKRQKIAGLFAEIQEKSAKVKALSYTHFLATLSQIAAHGAATLEDKDSFDLVCELLNKIRDKLAKRLQEVHDNYDTMIKGAEKSLKGFEDLLKQFQDDQKSTQDALNKLQGNVFPLSRCNARS